MHDLESFVTKRDGGSFWNYDDCLKSVLRIRHERNTHFSALCSVEKHCHWRSHGRSRLNRDNDLTLIPELRKALKVD